MITQKGNFNNTEKFLDKAKNLDFVAILENYGREGVDALSNATPELTGLTKDSWDYVVTTNGNTYILTWTNSNSENGLPVAILIQYGHGTRNGEYIPGYDFINPAIKPVIDKIIEDGWKEVTST